MEPFIEAARELVCEEGGRAITGSCGFLAVFQREIADAVDVPVFISSLIQIPIVYQMLRSDRTVGVMAATKSDLTPPEHLSAVGAANVPICVAGMDGQKEFCEVIIEQKRSVRADHEKCKDMSLKKVAKLAGVSHTTVSLVMNNTGGSRVNQRTRKRVLETARKLDYNPNLIAKRLVSGKTNSIGLYIPFETPIFRNYTIIDLVAGVQDVLNEKGFDLVLFSTGKNLWKTRPIDQIMKQNTVDGLIIFNTRYTTQHFVNKYINTLSDPKFNFVVLEYYWGHENIHYVGVDDEDETFKAVSYLINLGHRKIALIAGLSKARVTSKIIKGYKRALKKCKITIDKDIIVYADYDYQMAYQKTQGILKKNPSVTSFFVGGYEMAPACLKAVKDSGLSIPKDISIIGYIDIELMPLLDPPLTAVRLPYYEMGKKAAELLWENHNDKKKWIFETELVLRDSTASVRQW